MKIYIDGEWLEKADARVSVYDHGLLYGDGVFEGIRAYNGRVFKLEEHVDRLLDSCKGILLAPIWSRQELIDLIVEAVRVNKLRESYIRVVITRGVGDLGLDMRKCPKPSLIIIADKIALFSEEFYNKGLTLVTSSIRQTATDALNPNIKSLNYLNNIMVRHEATMHGAGEALVLNRHGYVSEGSGDNIFIMKNGEWTTPPRWCGILAGITRATAMDLIRDELKQPVREDVFTPFDIYRADEAFVCGTGAEILPAVELDGRKIGDGKPGKNTKALIAAFRVYANANGTPVYEKTAA